MTDDKVRDTAMEEAAEVVDNRVPFREHPLFVELEQQVADGDEDGAAQNLRALVELYPDEQTLRDLEVRAALRSSFSIPESLPIRRAQPGAMLRTLLLVLVAIAACLTVSAGFAIAYEEFVADDVELRRQEVKIAGLWQEAERMLVAGDTRRAREVVDELAVALPDSEEVKAAIRAIDERESLDQMYDSALQKELESDWAGALDLLSQLEAASPGYRDVRQRMADVERMIDLEASWAEAQRLVAASDWQPAIDILVDIRGRSPGFHRAEVDAYLFDAYSVLGMELLDAARGDVGQVEQAIEYLGRALELRPAQVELAKERQLAQRYLTGAAAYAEEKWSTVIESWEPVHRARPGYQGGVVDTFLYEAYPRAAAELVAGAGGAAKPLRQAVEYLDQVLMRPGDHEWVVQERTLATEYLAGLDAYNEARWDEAIVHWGPVYVARSSYQNGVLEEQLRVACAATEVAYDNWCSP